jgi:hypothetical protein
MSDQPDDHLGTPFPLIVKTQGSQGHAYNTAAPMASGVGNCKTGQAPDPRQEVESYARRVVPTWTGRNVTGLIG